MPFIHHVTRRLYPPDLYLPPMQPHHIHRAKDEKEQPINCTDHHLESCPNWHWIGGHPDSNWPHHVEFDGETGMWGYTRLSEEEIADLQMLWDYEAEQETKKIAAAKLRLKLLRDTARNDPVLAALLEQLGLA